MRLGFSAVRRASGDCHLPRTMRRPRARPDGRVTHAV